VEAVQAVVVVPEVVVSVVLLVVSVVVPQKQPSAIQSSLLPMVLEHEQ
jgi:hypothetical protein